MSKLIIALAFLFVSGCATIKYDPEPSNIDYGSEPKAYKDQIMQYWQSTLKDPNSIQIKKISEPEKAMVYSVTEKIHSYDNHVDLTFTPVYGYRVCATVNAKNSYGAYAGFKSTAFFFERDGSFKLVTELPKEFMESRTLRGSYSSGMRISNSSCN